jgi:hypothetical protein
LKVVSPLSLPLAFTLFASGGAPALAQTVSLGAIISSIRDSAGNPVSGALVVASGPTTRQASTNSAGIVTLLGLPAGTYSVRVTRSGFEPYGTTATIGSQADGIKILNLHVSTLDLAGAGSFGTGAPATPFGNGGAPYVAPQITAALAADVVPVRRVVTPLALPALALEGTQPGETRIELDGIPLAGGSASAAALRFRSAFDLDDVSFGEGPALDTPSLENAIGGIVAYRTAPVSAGWTSDFDLGYDSAFGAFEHARSSDTFGKAGFLVDAVSGENDDLSATAKAQLNLSRSTSLDLAAYETRDTATQAGTIYVDDAPAFAAHVRTTLGTGTLQARTFSSDSDTSVEVGSAPAEVETWQARGLTLDYAVPVGENMLRASYDRRSDELALDGGEQIAQSVSTLRLGAGLQLSRLSRLDLSDAISSGSELPHRTDPQAALTLRPGSTVTLRFAAGGAYETAPDELLAAAGAAGHVAPETSFGYRASADVTLPQNDRLRLAAFELRRFDTFADDAGARSSGLEFDFERQALPGRLGLDVGLGLTKTYAFGTAQPYLRTLLATPVLAGEQLPGDPYSKARLALTYDANVAEFSVGTTLLGANNALSNRAVALSEASLRLKLASVADLRLGLENLFGQAIASPEIAPLYPPHEVTLTLER